MLPSGRGTHARPCEAAADFHQGGQGLRAQRAGKGAIGVTRIAPIHPRTPHLTPLQRASALGLRSCRRHASSMAGPAHCSAPAIYLPTRSFFLTLACCGCQLKNFQGLRGSEAPQRMLANERLLTAPRRILGLSITFNDHGRPGIAARLRCGAPVRRGALPRRRPAARPRRETPLECDDPWSGAGWPKYAFTHARGDKLRRTFLGHGEFGPRRACSLSPSLRGEGRGEGQPEAAAQVSAPHPNPLPTKRWGEGKSRYAAVLTSSPATARSISLRVLSMPYSSTKLPKRGPRSSPSST